MTNFIFGHYGTDSSYPLPRVPIARYGFESAQVGVACSLLDDTHKVIVSFITNGNSTSITLTKSDATDDFQAHDSGLKYRIDWQDGKGFYIYLSDKGEYNYRIEDSDGKIIDRGVIFVIDAAPQKSFDEVIIEEGRAAIANNIDTIEINAPTGQSIKASSRAEIIRLVNEAIDRIGRNACRARTGIPFEVL